jgi:hypothetical protein
MSVPRPGSFRPIRQRLPEHRRASDHIEHNPDLLEVSQDLVIGRPVAVLFALIVIHGSRVLIAVAVTATAVAGSNGWSLQFVKAMVSVWR